MKKPLLVIFTLFTLALPAVCQNANAEQIEIRPAEAVERTERKPGFFERIFKRRRGDEQKAPVSPDKSEPEASRTPPTKKAIATEASEIEETPKPSRRKPTSTPTPAPSDDQGEGASVSSELSPSPEPDATPETAYLGAESEDLAKKTATPESIPAPASEPDSKPESTPKIEDEPDSSQLNQSIPFVSTPEPEKSFATPAPDVLDPEYVKRMNERYKKVRSEALSDERVSALRDEADGAFEPAKRAKALKVYYEALFQKMREIDPSLKSRIDGREKATMRRIESLTPVGE